MKRHWAVLAACTALSAACESDVTVHLLSLRSETSVGGEAGVATNEAGSAGEPMPSGGGGGGGDDEAGAGGAQPDLPPCQKLGAEVCNGGDDDCNGLVDEGCDYTITWKASSDTGALGHATGGVMFLAPCADGAVITGLRVGMGNWLNQVVAICQQVELHADTTQTPVAFSVTIGARVDSSYIPAATTDTTNKDQDLLCASGSVLIALDGSVAPEEAHYIHSVRLTCAPLTVNTAGSAPVLDVDRSQEKFLGPVVCNSCTTTPDYSFTATIPTSHVVTRIFGGDGLWVDRLGFGTSVASILSK